MESPVLDVYKQNHNITSDKQTIHANTNKQKLPRGLASRYCELSFPCVTGILIPVPICILVALLLVQLPAHTPGKANEDGPSGLAPASESETRMELFDLVFSLAHTWLLQPFWSKPLEERSLSLSFSLSLLNTLPCGIKILIFGVRIMAHQAKPPTIQVGVPVDELLTKPPADVPGEATEESTIYWAPATHVEDQDAPPGSWLQPAPAPGMEAICRVDQKIELSLCLK